MPAPVVRVEGAANLRATMRRAGVEMTRMSDTHARVSQVVAGAARTRVPVRSGALQSSIRGNQAVSRAIVRAGGARLPYAGVIHWGWPAHNIRPSLFITDAAAATEPVWTALYQQEIQKILNQVKGK